MTATTITRQSRSNLALAFISLGRERKRDITVFYAFCRVIDDIADSSELNVVEKGGRLAAWREMLRRASTDEPLLAREVRSLIDKYSLPIDVLEEIIAGVEMDLSISRYATFEELGFTVIGSPVPSAWLALRFSDIAIRVAKSMR